MFVAELLEKKYCHWLYERPDNNWPMPLDA